MPLRFPRPLRVGDLIGVTAPSAGVGARARPRFDFAIDHLVGLGFEVQVGACIDANEWVSAPKAARAAELTAMLLDPEIRAIVPPWGGAGTSLDLLDQLDWEAIGAAEPTWLVGYSDTSTVMTALTLRTGLATLHGDNLIDTPNAALPGLTHWSDFVSATEPVTQFDSRLVAERPSPSDATATEWSIVGAGAWRLHGVDRLDTRGTLIGGCIEVMAGIAGTPCGDVRAFGQEHGELIVYLEAAADDAFDICRALHHLRYCGWFDHATAVLIGRTNAPPGRADGGLGQDAAVLDALGGLGIPIVFDLEIGHVPPHLPLLNGATAHVTVEGDTHRIEQSWSTLP